MKIVFTNVSGHQALEAPQPAKNFIPEWYKKTESYINGKKQPSGEGKTEATIKRCMPVFDAITAGYVITLPADVFVSIKNDQQFFEWSHYGLVDWHPIEQAPLHPNRNEYPFPKWINHWSIKTPDGYSTLFVQPFHRDSIFTILPGIVDTDTYFAPVNFPFTINDSKFEGLIPKGTPIAQVIPFRRDNWKMSFGAHEEIKAQAGIAEKLNSVFFDRYKRFFRVNKDFS